MTNIDAKVRAAAALADVFVEKAVAKGATYSAAYDALMREHPDWWGEVKKIGQPGDEGAARTVTAARTATAEADDVSRRFAKAIREIGVEKILDPKSSEYDPQLAAYYHNSNMSSRRANSP